jgi:hypothetical protein
MGAGGEKEMKGVQNEVTSVESMMIYTQHANAIVF